MKHKKLLDAALVAALLLANIPELTEELLPAPHESALIEAAEAPRENAAERHG